jgi:hypothetical protein
MTSVALYLTYSTGIVGIVVIPGDIGNNGDWALCLDIENNVSIITFSDPFVVVMTLLRQGFDDTKTLWRYVVVDTVLCCWFDSFICCCILRDAYYSVTGILIHLLLLMACLRYCWSMWCRYGTIVTLLIIDLWFDWWRHCYDIQYGICYVMMLPLLMITVIIIIMGIRTWCRMYFYCDYYFD